MNTIVFDSLKEFHLEYPDCRAYDLIDQLILILENLTPTNRDETATQIEKLLDQDAAVHILKLFSEFQNVKYHFSNPKLLLHLLFFSKCYRSLSYVAGKLDLDLNEAQQLLDHLKTTFTIDDPLIWLENFKLQTKKQREYYELKKTQLLHGREAVTQAIDTAEERKVKLRHRLASYLKTRLFF